MFGRTGASIGGDDRDDVPSLERHREHAAVALAKPLLGLVMLLRGFADAIMMRTRQAIAVGDAQGYLLPSHYDQVFSALDTIMIFFVAMPLVIGLMNFAVPLQLGVRDVAFPVFDSVSLRLTATGALLIDLSLVIGNFAGTGWNCNFVATILKLRAPGMMYFRMPVFCWTALTANLLVVAAFPILTATFMMLDHVVHVSVAYARRALTVRSSLLSIVLPLLIAATLQQRIETDMSRQTQLRQSTAKVIPHLAR